MRVAGKRGARRRLAAAGVALALGACGFHLRESANLPFESLHPAFAPNSTLGVEFKRALRAATNTRIEPDRNQAQAILVSMTERREKGDHRVLLGGATARVSAAARIPVRPGRPARRRDAQADDDHLATRDHRERPPVALKEQEEVLLYREMQTDMVQQVLRRLSLIRVAKP
ncbi:MAG: hypothetical protein R3E48_21455 [Burkholderiaceae bacterium]